MKKKNIIIASIAGGVVVLFALIAVIFLGQQKFYAANVSGTGITAEQATQIALTHANLAESDVKFLRTSIDHEYGRTEYEVDFYNGFNEYSYDIDMESGEILGFDIDNIF